jgi:hypothetical protein
MKFYIHEVTIHGVPFFTCCGCRVVMAGKPSTLTLRSKEGTLPAEMSLALVTKTEKVPPSQLPPGWVVVSDSQVLCTDCAPPP